MIRALMRTTAWMLCAAAFAIGAQAQTSAPENNTAKVIPGQIVVDEATTVVQSMKQDPTVAGLVAHAKAVLVVPRYGANPARLENGAQRDSPEGSTTRASEAMVRHGSPGVFLVHSEGWSSPAFFSIANADMHAMPSGSGSDQQANERGVPVVLMFMTSHAADQLRGANTVSLSGLNVAGYSDHPRGAASNADVVAWTPHHVMQAATVAAAQIHYDTTASNAYYMNPASLQDILTDNVTTQRASRLQSALSTRVASSK
jgi:hypothetical protein